MNKIKILIADKLSPLGIDWLEAQDDVEVANLPGRDSDELAADIGNYDGMIIRSGVKAKGDVMANTGRLKGIARAGVGVDNIDIPLATEKGIIVMNTPDGNTISTCELAWALMLALSRNIAPANQSMRENRWDRKKFEGSQLAGKTLAVIGLGRIGQAVAERGVGFGMRVLGYDPFFAGTGDECFEYVKDLTELCKRADYITVHVPKTAETAGMIGDDQFAVMKPTTRLINAARGGIIDPAALLKALNEGQVAGAGIDVYTAEPKGSVKDLSPLSEAEQALVAHPKVLCVPHLGASTEEAQDQVAIDAAQQLVEALRGGEVRNAINAPGFGEAIPETLKPYAELAPRLGTLLASITPGAMKKVEVIYRGAISEMNVAPITTSLLVGLLQPHMDIPVNVINAPGLAANRGVEVEQILSGKAREFANLLEVKVTTDQGAHTAIGTIFGHKYPRIISIDGYHMEMRPEGHCVIILNDDKPGALGQYGSAFGKHGVNIADMTFSRKKSGLALVGINLDQEPADALMTEVKALPMVEDAWYFQLPVLPNVPTDT